MTWGPPAPTPPPRPQQAVYRVRRRRVLLGAVLAAFLAYGGLAAARHPPHTESHVLDGRGRASLAPITWPQ